MLKGSFICPSCNLDIEELFAKGYLLASNGNDNSIELFDGNIDDLAVDDMDDNIFDNQKSSDEIVIVVPENAGDDEIVIDLDDLGIDVESLDGEVNIIVHVEGADEFEEGIVDVEDFIDEPNVYNDTQSPV